MVALHELASRTGDRGVGQRINISQGIRHALALVTVFSVCNFYLMSKVHSRLTTKSVYLDGEVERGSFRTEQSNGWQTIHVYYGDENSSKNSNTSFSQVLQDEIILTLMAKLDDGQVSNQSHFFIDLAANDASKLSNTLRLENNGWEGLCIEPNPIYWHDLARRRCTVVAAFVGGAEDKIPVQVRLDKGVFGGIVGETMDNKAEKGSVKRYTVSLLSVFQKFHVPTSIDYLSLDVEGAESLIMTNFPFDKYHFKFMTVERPKPDLETLLNENGYLFVAKLVSFGETLWMHNTTALPFNETKAAVMDIARRVWARRPSLAVDEKEVKD